MGRDYTIVGKGADQTLGGQLKDIEFMPSTLETIDGALYDYIHEILNLHASTNKGWKKVPIIWVSAERAFQIKNNKDLRDSKGVLKLPLITIERTDVVKDASFKGVFQAHIPNGTGMPQSRKYRGGSMVIGRRIKQDKTVKFARADVSKKTGGLETPSVGHGQKNYPSTNKKIVYETMRMSIPTYVSAMYSIVIRTEYQQQVNQLVTPLITNTGQINNFVISKDGHKFEGFIEDGFAQENNVASLDQEERSYETSITVKVLGHLIGSGENGDQPKISVTENAVELKIGRERVITGDINEYLKNNKGFYRD